MIQAKPTKQVSVVPHSECDAVQVDVHHGMSRLDPAPDVELLDGVVTFERKVFTATGHGKIIEQVERCDLFDFDHRKRMVIPTGLVPGVADQLRQAGIRVEMHDLREFGPTHKPSKQVWVESDGDDRRLLRAVRQHPLGQIEVGSTSNMLKVMHLIYQFFPKANILIPVSTRKFAWYLWQELRGFVGPEVRLKRGSWPRRPPRCLVTTYQPLATCIPERWDIIFLPDPFAATQDRFSQAMGVFLGAPHRCYSLVRPGQRLGRRASIRLEAMSGSMIYESEPGRPAVEVLWLQSPQSPLSSCERRSLEWKRAVYWQNPRRNEYIASVARAFAERNMKKLRKYGVPFQGNKPVFTNSDAPEVVLLVESIEHGRELLKRLDGWELLDRVSGERNRAAASNAKGKIITATRAAVDGLEADVVIQAVGGSGVGVFQNTVAELTTDADHAPALIVDFVDSEDDMAAADARSRTRAYRRLGWEQYESSAPSSAGRGNRGEPRQEESTT